MPISLSDCIGRLGNHTFSPRRRSEQGFGYYSDWIYDGEDQAGFQSEWSSLDEGLNFLMSCLDPVKEGIAKALVGAEGLWWCGHFQSSFDGGPTLQPTTLRRLAQYSCPVFIDNYFSGQ